MTNAMGCDFLSKRERIEARLWKSQPFFVIRKYMGVLSALFAELGYSLRAVQYVELLEDTLQVIFDGKGADIKNQADFMVGFAFGDPVHDLQLSA